jgi:hypothetical protein
LVTIDGAANAGLDAHASAAINVASVASQGVARLHETVRRFIAILPEAKESGFY